MFENRETDGLHQGVANPVRVNPIPRQIPPGPKYLRPWAATLLAGILPFGEPLSVRPASLELTILRQVPHLSSSTSCFRAYLLQGHTTHSASSH